MPRALTTIKEQVQRGVDLTAHLNRFAHEPDGEICLRSLEQDGKIHIHILCRGEGLDDAVFTEFFGRYEKWPALLKLAENLGGSVEPDGSVRGISIQLPKKIPV